MDLAFSTSPGRSQKRVEFQPFEILRLWSGLGREFLTGQRSPNTKGYCVAAILPMQEVSFEDYELLEDLGMLVVEVPSYLKDASDTDVADYLTHLLDEGRRATAARMEAIGTADSDAAGVGKENDLHMSRDEDAALLDFVNDPANQLGGHF
jgi:hypothetical protein